MKNKEDLKKELIKIDHKSYGMYKTLGGSYSYGNYILHIDHVQGDPFASPSRLRSQNHIPNTCSTVSLPLHHYFSLSLKK